MVPKKPSNLPESSDEEDKDEDRDQDESAVDGSRTSLDPSTKGLDYREWLEEESAAIAEHDDVDQLLRVEEDQMGDEGEMEEGQDDQEDQEVKTEQQTKGQICIQWNLDYRKIC